MHENCNACLYRIPKLPTGVKPLPKRLVFWPVCHLEGIRVPSITAATPWHPPGGAHALFLNPRRQQQAGNRRLVRPGWLSSHAPAPHCRPFTPNPGPPPAPHLACASPDSTAIPWHTSLAWRPGGGLNGPQEGRVWALLRKVGPPGGRGCGVPNSPWLGTLADIFRWVMGSAHTCIGQHLSEIRYRGALIRCGGVTGL